MTHFLQAVWFSVGQINSSGFSVSRSLMPHCSFVSGFVQSAMSAFGSKLLKMDLKFYFLAKDLVSSTEGKENRFASFKANIVHIVNEME